MDSKQRYATYLSKAQSKYYVSKRRPLSYLNKTSTYPIWILVKESNFFELGSSIQNILLGFATQNILNSEHVCTSETLYAGVSLGEDLYISHR